MARSFWAASIPFTIISDIPSMYYSKINDYVLMNALLETLLLAYCYTQNEKTTLAAKEREMMLAIFKHNIQANPHWNATSFKELWINKF